MTANRPSFVTRRRLLGTAGGLAALSVLPASMRKAAAAPHRQLRSLEEIQHVIILMQENRSFDQYFGSLPGVRGFDDPTAITLPNGRSVFHQPDPQNPDGYLLPFRNDTTTTSAAIAYGTSHSWHSQHRCWNHGRMDRWVRTHRAADGPIKGPFTMGYHTREDLPYHYALADAFTVCDHYFSSVLGPTHPNRVMAMSGTIDPHGLRGGPVVDNHSGSFRWTTYPERLQAAGVSWRYCAAQPRDTGLSWFAAFQHAKPGDPLFDNAMVPYSPSQVADLIRSGDLPSVLWLDAQYTERIYGVPEAAEGTGALPAAGAQYIDMVLDALGSRPQVWERTVFLLSYDENDGRFDHVPPPTPAEGTTGEWITARSLPPGAEGIRGPIGPGFRVPALVISPWSRGGWVCSEPFEHTSTLRFLERRFGVRAPNISTWRRQNFGDLTSTLHLGSPVQAPSPLPALPDAAALYRKERHRASTLPRPTIPKVQALPHQEPGRRPRVP